VSSLHYNIESKTEQLQAVRRFVSDAASKFGFDEDSVGKIALAVDEACTNVIKHSYGFDPGHRIDLHIEMRNGTFEVIIAHNGKSFNPEAVKAPDMREYLSKFRRGGLGMHLMRSLMDKVEYKSLENNRHEVHLVKNLPIRVNK
jgi:serine/threonine-protein kinase RsbW